MGPKFEGVWSNVRENIDCLEFAGARDFFYFFYFLRSTATLSPKKVIQKARKEPGVQLHIPPALNFYRVHPRFCFI